MTATSIAPLRKRNTEGGLYTRLPEIEAKLVELHALPRKDLMALCEVTDIDDKEYVPSECLMTLVRAYRSQPLDACGEALFKALVGRVLRGLPKAESPFAEKEDLARGNARDEATFRFLEMLGRDRQGDYVEELDFYEVRFGLTLKRLRIDAERKIGRRQNPLETLEVDDETGDISPEVEKAAASFNPFDSQKFQDFDYKLLLDAAINSLPGVQKAIIEMIRKEIPIESKEPGKITISGVLQKTPKTIATHRDKAYATLRVKLTKGEPV